VVAERLLQALEINLAVGDGLGRNSVYDLCKLRRQ
jgi:hypothetical protein